MAVFILHFKKKKVYCFYISLFTVYLLAFVEALEQRIISKRFVGHGLSCVVYRTNGMEITAMSTSYFAYYN